MSQREGSGRPQTESRRLPPLWLGRTSFEDRAGRSPSHRDREEPSAVCVTTVSHYLLGQRSAGVDLHLPAEGQLLHRRDVA